MWSRRCRACALSRAARVCVVARLHRLEVGAEGDLRVDDDVLAADQPHDQVGPDRAVGAGRADLGLVVDVLAHAGGLDRALELQLAPPAADLRRAQRGDQLRGLGAQLLGGLPHAVEVLAQRGLGVGAPALGRDELLLHPLQRLAHRRDHRLDRLLPLAPGRRRRRCGRRPSFDSASASSCSLLRASASADSAPKVSRSCVVVAGQQLLALGRRAPLGLEQGVQAGGLGAAGLDLGVGAASRGQPADRERRRPGQRRRGSTTAVMLMSSMLAPRRRQFRRPTRTGPRLSVRSGARRP